MSIVPYDSSVCLSPATPGEVDYFRASAGDLSGAKRDGHAAGIVKLEPEWSGPSVLSSPDASAQGPPPLLRIGSCSDVSGLRSPSAVSDVSDRDPGKLVARSNSRNEDICLICGDRASGYHYNALSCEGCKGFFRRSITRNATYQCKYGGHCEMDMWMRRRCQACRLKRCREVGMKEECLLSDEQCKARDVRRKARQGVHQDHRGGRGLPEATTATVDYVLDSLVTPPQSTDNEPGTTCSPLDKVSNEARELIRELVHYQDVYELPKEDDFQKVNMVKVSDLGRPKEMSEQVYQTMAGMTILVTHLVVEFAKKIPGFLQLECKDQITLLKGSSSEVMILRTARRYDLDTDTVVFAGGTPFTRDSLRYAGLGSYADSLFAFCKGMAILGVDNAEYALLTSLCIVEDRSGLIGEREVTNMQDRFINALLEYVKCRRPQGPHLARLLMKLTQLRQLSIEHSDVLSSLKVERGSLPPLLAEYFDIV